MRLVLQKRGQITLPSAIRKRFSLHEGGILSLEEKNGEIVLRPGIFLEFERYTDAQIKDWDKEDLLDKRTETKIRKRLQKKS